MSQENVETVRRHLEAYFSGDYETALDAYDPAVEYDVSTRPEGRVLLVVDRQSGRGKGSGVEFDQQTFWVYTLREGKITRVMWSPTRSRALEAAGLSEE